MRHKLFLQGLLLFSIISIGLTDDNHNGEEIFDNQNTPLPFALSIVGSPHSGMNPYYNQTTNIHLSIISGNVKSVQGFQVGAVSNFVRADFLGYDVTGVYTRVGGNFSGSQTSGVLAHVQENFYGLQSAGILGSVGGDFFGLQTSGIISTVEGDFTGLQTSGVMNKASNVKLLQIAGVINEAKDVQGVQVSGVVNKADHVRGVQIGLINKSKKLDGIAIGLVNISESGSVNFVSWGTSPENMHAGIKFAPNDYWYTILTLGNMNELNNTELGSVFQGRMGVHLDIVPKLFVEMDLGGGNSIPGSLSNIDDESAYRSVLEARLSMGYRFGSRLAVSVGVSNTKVGKDVSWFHQDKGEIRPFFGIQI